MISISFDFTSLKITFWTQSHGGGWFRCFSFSKKGWFLGSNCTFWGSKWLSPKQHWAHLEMSGCLTRYPTKTVNLWVFLQFRSFFDRSCLLFLKTCLNEAHFRIFCTFVSAFFPFPLLFRHQHLPRQNTSKRDAQKKAVSIHDNRTSLSMFSIFVAFMCKASGFP